ncbi:hypothetical protein B7463_g11934, partial [Scytalidium lignicola]
MRLENYPKVYQNLRANPEVKADLEEWLTPGGNPVYMIVGLLIWKDASCCDATEEASLPCESMHDRPSFQPSSLRPLTMIRLNLDAAVLTMADDLKVWTKSGYDVILVLTATLEEVGIRRASANSRHAYLINGERVAEADLFAFALIVELVATSSRWNKETVGSL